MKLNRILEQLVASVPGAGAAALLDWEGESVVLFNQSKHSDYQIKLLGAHHGIILDRARQMIKRLSLGGEPTELIFSLQNLNVVTMPVNHEYYLMLTLRPGSAPVFAGGALRRAAAEIEADIS